MTESRGARWFASGAAAARASSHSSWSNAGKLAAAAWIAARGSHAPTSQRWHVEIALDIRPTPAIAEFDDRVDTRFHLDVYSEEWGYLFCHGGRASWIRVTDIPFVHGRDDFSLLASATQLDQIGTLVRSFESTHSVQFRREHALVRTNLLSAEASIRRWVMTL